jgi:Polysulphide reductase, NrfD
MAIDATVPVSTGYATRPVTKVPAWHGLVAWDMLFNNLTTGLFLVAALGDLTRPALFAPLAKVAYPLALILLLADLGCLVLDLGDPQRFHHMLRILKPTSPMSLGTWCLTIYSLPLTTAALLSVLPTEWPALALARKVFVVLGLLPALGSALYKGVLLSTNAQPGWRDARWLGGYLANSAFLLGCAQLLAVAVIMRQEPAILVLRVALAILLVLNAVFMLSLRRDLRTALGRIFAPRQLWQFGLVAVGGGALVPLALVLLGASSPVLLAAVTFLLLGNLTTRFVIINVPHVLSQQRSV